MDVDTDDEIFQSILPDKTHDDCGRVNFDNAEYGSDDDDSDYVDHRLDLDDGEIKVIILQVKTHDHLVEDLDIESDDDDDSEFELEEWMESDVDSDSSEVTEPDYKNVIRPKLIKKPTSKVEPEVC